MIQMRKRRAALACIILIILGSAVWWKVSSKDVLNCQQSQVDNPMDEMIQYLIEADSFQYDEEKIKEWNTGTYHVLLEEEEKKSWKALFIQASIDMFYAEYESAIKNFQQCAIWEEQMPLNVKARMYYELSKVYIYMQQYEASTEIAEKMTKLYAKEADKSYLIQLNIWRRYDVMEMPDGAKLAVQIMEDTIQIAQEMDYDQMEVVYFYTGMAYSFTEQYAESMAYKLKTIREAQKNNNITYVMRANIEIGTDYMTYDNYSEGLKYLYKALEYNLEIQHEDAELKAYAWNNVISTYVHMQEFKKAEEAVRLCEQEIERLADGASKRDAMLHLDLLKAEILAANGQEQEAVKLLLEVKKSYEKIVNFSYYNFDVLIRRILGSIHYLSGNYEEALKYHKETEELWLERGMGYTCEIGKLLTEDYEALGDYKNAQKYSEIRNSLRMEAITKKDNQYARLILEAFENEEDEKKIDRLSRRKQNMITVGAVLAVILTGVVINGYNIAKKNQEIKRLNAILKGRSTTDGLTHIANRRAFHEYMKHSWKQKGHSFSCFMIDIDYFKAYNDHYGHLAGDKLLECVAKGLQECCHSEEFLARYGGEEFVMVLPDTGEERAVERAGEIIEALKQLNLVHEYSKVADRITLSIGIAVMRPEDAKTYEEFITMADQALYEAKKTRDCYYLWRK